MNILFLSRWFPFPANNGSRIRIFHLLQGLSRSHHITLLSFSDAPLPSPERVQQIDICSNIKVVPWKPYNSGSLKARLGFFNSMPRSLVDTYSAEMDHAIRTELQNRKYNLVIASEMAMAAYYPSFTGVPAIFEDMELGAFSEEKRDAQIAKRLRARITWLKLQRYISSLLDVFELTTVVSDRELGIVEKKFPGRQNKVAVLPNGVDLNTYYDLRVERRPKHIIFSGSFSFPANYEAMQWFVGAVYPLIIEQIPDVQLIITGEHANMPLPSMQNLTLAGYVDDIKSLIASSDISIAPIWSGGGTRIKILEAMAAGTPVVSTSKGAEGLLAQNGKDILIADGAQEFASQVIRLILDENLRRQISLNARQLVKSIYDWGIIMPQFLHFVDRVTVG